MATTPAQDCDRCGEPIPERLTRVQVITGPLAELWPEFTLCRGCSAALAEFLGSHLLPPTPPRTGRTRRHHD